MSGAPRPLEISGLSFVYPMPPALFLWLMGGKARSVKALSGLSLSLEPGEKLTIMGRNGAGKTTFLKLVMGLLRPVSGSVTVMGGDPSHKETRKLIGFAQSDERSFYFRLSALENLLFFGGIWGMEGRRLRTRIDEVADELSLREFLGEPFAQLSSGMKQRISIARALIHDPPLLLLDEPTRSLDLVAQEEVHRLVRGPLFERKTVVTSTHKPEEAKEISTRCVVLNGGEAVYDGPPPSEQGKLMELLERRT